jgi:hypothetical protein
MHGHHTPRSSKIEEGTDGTPRALEPFLWATWDVAAIDNVHKPAERESERESADLVKGDRDWIE